MSRRIANRCARSLAALLLAGTAALPAWAGESVLYDPAPAWVEVAAVEPKPAGSNAIIVLLDQQARIEPGRLWTYVDTAVALDSPEALTQFGTLTASWMPDKGDLVVHRVELLRDGAVIDVLKGGAQFEVLRRERGLESRLVNGALTATLAVPGAKLGDVLRLAYSTTLSDQAMGENVQWQSGLIAEPFPLVEGRFAVSWPEAMPVSRLKIGKAAVAEPNLADGFYTWSARMPVPALDPMPEDAPARFRIGELMQVSTYADWEAVSRNQAQHYRTAGTVTQDGDLAARIAGIAAASPDPLTRAALALRLVQDDISYLMNGMAGGNYIPQSPEQTWAKRFGDCKAKTLLLLAMLRELGIEAEAVLVRTQGGDALPQLAPMPGNFDHVIVRAAIGGTNYWLDGTTSGVRLDTIDEVPRFFHALPLRDAGAGLMPLDTRVQSTPDRMVRLTLDQRAGLRLPAIYDLTIAYRGTAGAGWRALADQGNAEMRRNAVIGAVAEVLGDTQVIEQSVTYDAEAGLATLTARGIIGSAWTRDGADYRFDPPAQAARNVGFEADRARAAWRAIPLALNGPVYYASTAEVLLPDDLGGVQLEGSAAPVAATIGGVELASTARLEGRRLAVEQTMRSLAEELRAEDIGTARRTLNRFDRQLPVLRTSGAVRELWQYFGADRARLSELEALLADAIADAEPKDASALLNRAGFRMAIYDHAGALTDIEAAMAIADSRDLFLARAGLRRNLGDLDGALADLVEAESLQPDGETYFEQIELLALLGRAEEGLALAEDFEALTKERSAGAGVLAAALGWQGAAQEGIALLDDMVAERPSDGTLLNALCWQAAIWSQVDEGRLETCTRAVQTSDNASVALDSRALAHFRLGNLAAAKADIDAALQAEPYQVESRLLRGIILRAMGDKAGKDEIALALKMRPALAATYRAWGLSF
jgi:transglutaminase-like putative cysteine protease/tetratricopeptide (TPR) repeat protein